ncbi:MAG: ubiquinol-cytochrome c reductase iron-sulfur subunit, partial [Nitrososphaerales archaeon]
MDSNSSDEPSKREDTEKQATRRNFLKLVTLAGALVAAGGISVYAAAIMFKGKSISPTSSETTSKSSSESSSGSLAQGQQILDPTTGAVIRTTDIPENEALTFVYPRTGNTTIDADTFHQCLLVHLPPGLTAPSNLSAKDPVSGDTFIAFSSVCVHLWCLVSYVPSDKLLECPCHGGEYLPGTGLYPSLPSASNQPPGMAIAGPPALQT